MKPSKPSDSILKGFPAQVEDLCSRYDAVLEGGWKLNPPEPPDGGPGRTAQTDTVNLLRRLQDGAGEVLHFTRNSQVTFTNNEAEREVRMPKVKLKVAGSFRTPWGFRSSASRARISQR